MPLIRQLMVSTVSGLSETERGRGVGERGGVSNRGPIKTVEKLMLEQLFTLSFVILMVCFLMSGTVKVVTLIYRWQLIGLLIVRRAHEGMDRGPTQAVRRGRSRRRDNKDRRSML